MEENPKLALGLIAAITLAGFAFSSHVKKSQEERLRQIEEMEGGGRGAEAPPRSDRLSAVEKSRHREPLAALEQLDAIVASPVDADEACQAKELHPRLLRDVMNHLVKKGEWEEGRKILNRVVADYPDSESAGWARNDWASARGDAASRLARSGKSEEAYGMLRELADDGWVFKNPNVLADAQKALAQAWSKAGAARLDDPLLLKAADLAAGFSRRSAVVTALVESVHTGEAIRRQGDELQSGDDRFKALAFYEAALLRLGDNRKPWSADGADLSYERREALRREVEPKHVQLVLALGNAMHAGDVPLISAADAETTFQSGARIVRDNAAREPLFRRLVEIQTERLMRISEPLLETALSRFADTETFKGDSHNAMNKGLREAWGLADNIRRRSGSQWWMSLVANTNFNPYPLLPDAVRADFEARRAKGDREESLRQSIGSLAGRRGFQIPLDELKRVRQRHAEITARRGLLTYDVQPAECTRWFRQALADSEGDALRTEIVEATIKALFNSRKEDKFVVFYELTSFFVADIGVENVPAPLRKQFLGALGEAATALASKEPPEAVFLQAIQAETEENPAEAIKAEQAAMTSAYQIVARVRTETEPAETFPPSGLEGLSVLTVDNSTEHHLLVFYKGPESFFLACRPYRKLSAALKDGDYEIAVVAHSGAISPYHGKVALKGAWQKSIYTVGRSNEDRDLFNRSSAAHGEYVLARTTKDAGSFQIDVRTGSVAKTD